MFVCLFSSRIFFLSTLIGNCISPIFLLQPAEDTELRPPGQEHLVLNFSYLYHFRLAVLALRSIGFWDRRYSGGGALGFSILFDVFISSFTGRGVSWRVSDFFALFCFCYFYDLSFFSYSCS